MNYKYTYKAPDDMSDMGDDKRRQIFNVTVLFELMRHVEG